MTPIHQLLNRIRWDKEFSQGCFEIAYYDRMEKSLHLIGLQQIAFPEGERRIFEIIDESGQRRRVPFHRVREVYRDGRLIWRRPPVADNQTPMPKGQEP